MPNCQTYESKDADKMVLFITGIKIIDVETLKIVSVYIGDHSEQLENHIAAKLLNLVKTQTESIAFFKQAMYIGLFPRQRTYPDW